MIITADFETKSEADLRAVGAWAYSEHPSTDAICFCWAVDEEPTVHSWVPGEPPPADLFELLAAGALFEAHNAAFEWSIWANVMVPKYGWPPLKLEQIRDTMAVACYYSLPPGLGDLCKVLGLEGKDAAGDRLITKYSKLHLKTAQPVIPPEDVDAFVNYCIQDVRQEREASLILGELPPEELEIFQHDFKVAARGILLDVESLKIARLLVEQRAEQLASEFRELTGFEPTQVAKVLSWVNERLPEPLPDLQADTIDDFLEEQELTTHVSPVIQALRLRRRHSKSSTKKIDAMLRQRGKDGRARFQTRYHGAVTGRNTGAGFQPLNLNRGFDDVDPDTLVNDIRHGDAARLDIFYGDATDAIGKASRNFIFADKHHRIIAGDFSSIEAIVNACLAGEEWKIDLFRQEKPRVYETTAEKIHKLPAGTVTKATHPTERQDGKTCELAFGYQGSVGAWRKFDSSDRHSDERVLEFVREWRHEHPMIRDQWYCLEDACLEAVQYPGRETGYRMISFERVDGWLTMRLPDGKRLWYWAPEIRLRWPQWHDPKNNEECAAGECGHEKKPQVSYMARKEGQWRRVYTYGGKLTENAVQGAARQILKPIELRLEAAGYPLILSVYDEAVAEVPDWWGSLDDFTSLMEEPAGDWCADWPIRAEPWEGRRYRK